MGRLDLDDFALYWFILSFLDVEGEVLLVILCGLSWWLLLNVGRVGVVKEIFLEALGVFLVFLIDAADSHCI